MTKVRKKILIVDDEQGILSILESLLKNLDIDVVTATDGIECGVQLFDNNFDLVITDLNMPNKDGLKTIKHLKKGISEANRKLDIIVFSAYVSSEIEEELKGLGVSYVKKGSDLNLLISKVAEILEI